MMYDKVCYIKNKSFIIERLWQVEPKMALLFLQNSKVSYLLVLSKLY